MLRFVYQRYTENRCVNFILILLIHEKNIVVYCCFTLLV